jgi:hypothetical protein
VEKRKVSLGGIDCKTTYYVFLANWLDTGDQSRMRISTCREISNDTSDFETTQSIYQRIHRPLHRQKSFDSPYSWSLCSLMSLSAHFTVAINNTNNGAPAPCVSTVPATHPPKTPTLTRTQTTFLHGIHLKRFISF